MAQTLKQRMSSYEESTSIKIINRIPIIIEIDGRSFYKITRNVQKPFCSRTMEILSGTMLSLAKKISGSVFGYQYSDKIILVLRNDRSENEDPWFANETQAMCSAASSMATYEFMNLLWQIDKPPNLEGDISFKSRVFGIPSIKETINYIIYKQYNCMQYAINETVYSVLGRGSVIDNIGIDERKSLLDKAGVSLDKFPASFHHGSAVYVKPKLIHTDNGVATQHKWLLDFDVPLFVEKKNTERLVTILSTGSDIWRPERDL